MLLNRKIPLPIPYLDRIKKVPIEKALQDRAVPACLLEAGAGL